MDAIRHHHRSHNHLPTRYTPTLYYTWYTSVAQPPSQDMVTLYTRHTTVVQPTPDLPTFYTRYANLLHQICHQPTKISSPKPPPTTPTTPCTRYINIQHQRCTPTLNKRCATTVQSSSKQHCQLHFYTRYHTNWPKVMLFHVYSKVWFDQCVYLPVPE